MVVEKGKDLAAQQAPLLSLRSQRASLESEKREKDGTSTYTAVVLAALVRVVRGWGGRGSGLAEVEGSMHLVMRRK